MSCYSFRSSRTLDYHSILPGIVRRVKTELSPWRIHYLYLFGGEREILAQLRRLARFFCALLLLLWLPQAVWAHRRPLYICPEPPADLAAILDGGELSAQAPSLVTAETGLSPLAVRQLLAEVDAAFPERRFRIAVCGSGGKPIAEAMGVHYI